MPVWLAEDEYCTLVAVCEHLIPTDEPSGATDTRGSRLQRRDVIVADSSVFVTSSGYGPTSTVAALPPSRPPRWWAEPWPPGLGGRGNWLPWRP